MKLASGLVALAISISSAVAVVPQWGQCGGVGYSGETECASGLVCHPYNDWYSQCIEGQAPTSTASSSISSAPPSSTPTSSATSSSSAPPTSTSAPPTPTGFVGVSGTEFTLNGAKYTVVGTNSYWVGLSNFGDGDMNQAFADIAAAGGTTVRTWGFNEITTGSYWAAYYQNWSGSTPTVNLGADGLQTFDRVVAAAKANGIRLIVALTNNWSDYGGMDVYVKQILGSDNHDLFYTDPQVIAAYKSYVQTFVSRYANEPGIMAWELANEPRCRGSTGISTGTCTSATITAWAQDLSAFIKSIDPNHLVALGDEGFFNQPGHPSYPYQGSEGIDFDVNLAISTLDFGTVHAYPDHWGVTTDKTVWGNQWITDHAASMNAANKPVILEEFGILDGKPTTYASWFDTIYNSGLSGDLYWQAGSRYSWGSTHDDGYAIYPDSPEYPIIADHAADLKARPA